MCLTNTTYGTESTQNQVSICIPICVESGIDAADALVEGAAVSTRFGVDPLEYVALVTFESVVAGALVWVHARAMPHAFLATSAVVSCKFTPFVCIYKIEETWLGHVLQ